MLLKNNFYDQKTLVTAQRLVGCFLCRKIGNKVIKGQITETEAYCGTKDLASHASRGRTSRTEVMFGPAGKSYVYLIYGMYYCLNIVTEKINYPAATLIRAAKFNGIEYKKTNGPGKLCKFLKIDKTLNNIDITKKEKLWIEKNNSNRLARKIKKTPRIGVDYAGDYKNKKWRFVTAQKFN